MPAELVSDVVNERDRAMALLRQLVRRYSPEWHYEMGKTGYECSWCRVVVRSSSDFWRREHHHRNCDLIETLAWLEQQEERNANTGQL